MKNTISKNSVRAFIRATDGRFFRMTYQKKDGSVRNLTVRTGVSKGVKGTGRAYDPADYGLITLFEVNGGFKAINPLNILEISFQGKTFLIK